MATGEDGRGIVNEDVYGFWVDRGKDIVVSRALGSNGRAIKQAGMYLICRICGIGPSTLSTTVNQSDRLASWAIVSYT